MVSHYLLSGCVLALHLFLHLRNQSLVCLLLCKTVEFIFCCEAEAGVQRWL